jgi:hypothetical protein
MATKRLFVPVVGSLHAYAFVAFECPVRVKTSMSPSLPHTLALVAFVDVDRFEMLRFAPVHVANCFDEGGDAGGVGHGNSPVQQSSPASVKYRPARLETPAARQSFVISPSLASSDGRPPQALRLSQPHTV